jgi:transcriptional regulator with XRE-family HTH domain
MTEDQYSNAEIGKRLRRLRKAMSPTQREWAGNIGMSAPAWSNIEHGRNVPFWENARRIVLASGVSLDWIFFGIDLMMPRHITQALKRVGEAEVAGGDRAAGSLSS